MAQLIEEKIKQIHEKLLLLSRQNAAIIKENQSLKQSLEEALQSAQKAGADAETLQHQIDINKYSQAQMQPEERKAFEKKINTYIKEIDKCIALLSI